MRLRPRHLGRATEIVTTFAGYGFHDLVVRFGLERFVRAPWRPAPEGEGASLPERLRMALEELGPTFVKLGQLLSSRPELLSHEYLEELRKLQDTCTPIEFDRVRPVIESELGRPIEQGFSSFDTEPISSASIGLVYRARRLDGTEVAVKVQRPDIRERVEMDLDILVALAQLLDRHAEAARKLDLTGITRLFREILLDELDYVQEARNTMQMRARLREFGRLQVPEVVEPLSSRRVLTMSYHHGRPLNDLPRQGIDTEQVRRLGEDLTRAYLKQLMVDGMFHCDPHPGNLLLDLEEDHLVLLDFGMVARLSQRQQVTLLQILLGVNQNRGEKVAKLCLQLGDTDDVVDVVGFSNRVVSLVSRYHDAAIDQVSFGEVLFELIGIGIEYGVRLPPVVSLLGKMMMQLEQIGRLLAPDFNPNRVIGSYTFELMRQRFGGEASLPSMYSTMLDVDVLLADLPARLSTVVEHLERNRLRVGVDLREGDRLLDGVRKIANRIALSVIAAALILGSSNLLGTQAGPHVWGYPVLALGGFLGAAGLGVYLCFKVLLVDRD